MNSIAPPQLIEIEPTMGCNLKCRMCHTTYINEPHQYLDLDKITDFTFLKEKIVILGSVFEPFIHPEINRLIDILNKQKCKLVIISNAHNLNKNKVPAIFDSDLDSVTISFDGITKPVYEKIRLGGDFDLALEHITQFRNEFFDRKTFFSINYTVLQSNLHEVISAPSFWEKYNIDLIRFIPMVIRNDNKLLKKESIWVNRNVFFQYLDNAARSIDDLDLRISIMCAYFESPMAKYKFGKRIENGVYKSRKTNRNQRIYHREFEHGIAHGMAIPCKSPFNAARITWDGALNLCHSQPVGNLYENKFSEIWNGSKAIEYRISLLKNVEVCEHCDYFRFCINSHYLNLEDKNNYYDKNVLNRS